MTALSGRRRRRRWTRTGKYMCTMRYLDDNGRYGDRLQWRREAAGGRTMEEENGKTRKLVSLFVAAELVVAPGCGSRQTSAECWDDNNDGYCDDDGVYVGGSGYHYIGGRKSYY